MPQDDDVAAKLNALLFQRCPDCGAGMVRSFSMQADLSMKERPSWCMRCRVKREGLPS